VLRAAAILAPATVTVSLFTGLGELPHFNPDFDTTTPYFRIGPGVSRAGSMPQTQSSFALRSTRTAYPVCSRTALDWLVSGPEVVYKPIGLLNASPRSTHAQASLAETLRTMSTELVPGASISLALDGRRLDAAEMVAIQNSPSHFRAALHALPGAIEDYRAPPGGSTWLYFVGYVMMRTRSLSPERLD
jgi:hypothetical protein